MMPRRKTSFDKSMTNLCKGIAVCIMVYYHAFGATDRMAFTAVWTPLLNILGPYGDVCVCFFVLLTGYGIGLISRERKIPYGSRVAVRFAKLYRNFWPVFLLAVLLNPLLSTGDNRLTAVFGQEPFWFLSRFLLNFLGLSHYVYGGGAYTMNQTWWYLSLALILILVLPLLVFLWQRLGWKSLVLVTALAVLLPDVRYLGYFPCAMLGVCLARSNGFVAVHEKGRGPVGLLIRVVALGMILLLWYRMRQHIFQPLLADALAAYGVCQFAFDVLSPIPVLSPVLQWLGKHSANIFYLHSFVYSLWAPCSRFVFRFRYDLLIWALVMAVTCVISVLLEWVKDRAGYNRGFARLEKKLLALTTTQEIPG